MDISRRQFQRGILTAGSLLAGGAVLRAEEPRRAEEVYRHAIVLDTLASNPAGFDPGPALAAGITGAVVDLAIPERNRENALRELAAWAECFASPASRCRPVLAAEDFALAKREGKFGVVLNCQDGSILGTPIHANSDRNIKTLEQLHGLGLRVLEPVYTSSNGLGSGYSEPRDCGLTRLGIATIEAMDRLRMMIDVSHCGEETTRDILKRSARPVVVTHGGCYALYPDKRNKTDEVIRLIADKGGYYGIFNMTLWMTRAPVSSVETIVDHIDHVVRTGGVEIAGFGSDHPVNGDLAPQSEKVEGLTFFNERNRAITGAGPIVGHVTAPDMDGPDRLQRLADSLARRRYRSDAIEKILGGNFIRVFRDVCG